MTGPSCFRNGLLALVLAVFRGPPTLAQPAPSVVRAVMNGDLRGLDPLWTVAPRTRIHANMVYDTLFGTDDKGQSRPRMVDMWTVSDDKLVYRFKLRDGLRFSDVAAVTSGDVIASLKRWMLVDSAGQYVAQALSAKEPVGQQGFVLRLKAPFPQLICSFGKPSAVPSFIYPARIIDGLLVSKQLTDPTGSATGPEAGAELLLSNDPEEVRLKRDMALMRAAWLKGTDPVQSRALAVAIQRHAMEIGLTIPYGQYLLPAVWRDSLDGVLDVPEHVVFWNMRKRR